jgi:hypothetical protein
MNKTTENKIRVLGGASDDEKTRRANFVDQFKNSPIPSSELLQNLGLYLSRQNLSRILYIHELYKQILDVHGVVMEFGVRWGQNMALYESLRGIYEPYNYSRKIVGFDTFDGFPSTHAKDGEKVKSGDYSVSADYETYLGQVLDFHEKESPVGHLKKYEIVKGDAAHTIHSYLEQHPETMVALAYFDFDIYEPTKACLEAILPRLTKGSVLAFDELNCSPFPGETLAVMEVLGLGRYRIRRTPLNPLCSFLIID